MTDEPLVSVVLPVWRDETLLARGLDRLAPRDGVEIVVACVLGEEPRYAELREQHPSVVWVSAPRGRAAQMNAGAAKARGRWLLFLHADSVLPADWIDVIRDADRRPDVVAGAFRLALDSRDWRARAIEAGVRIRVALFTMPYGDQALFVRRRALEQLGGYRDLPLMEDIDLVRRLKRVGRIVAAHSIVVTSARRWERDGWMRRSAQNVMLATRFVLGASPARLAQRYCARKPAAIVVMARAPWTGGKTRLAAGIDRDRHAGLRTALFFDTLDATRSVAGVEQIVACEPADACERMREVVGPPVDVIAQHGGDLGERMAHVFADVFRLGMESVVVIGSDLPDLPSHLVAEAVSALHAREDQVVLGPARDGGYYLIGMNRPHPELFEGIEWSTEHVLDETLQRLTARNVRVTLLAEWEDVDTAADLTRLVERAAAQAAPRTRAWAAGNLR